MNNRYWKENSRGAWCLYFNPYQYDEELILSMVQDEEDKTCWVYVSDLLKVEHDFIWADDLEEAKEEAENMVLEHYQDQANYYEDMIDKWNEW